MPWLILLLLVGQQQSVSTPITSNDRGFHTVSGGQPLFSEGANLRFFRNGHTWTIVGANQPAGPPAKGRDRYLNASPEPELRILNQPITDERILPFSDPTANMRLGTNLHFRLTPGEYEPASFVLRSGTDELKDVRMEVHPPSNSEHVIPPRNFDVRLVKVWYQAGHSVARRPTDRKTLAPELLLKDNEAIHVDHGRQVNLIRDRSKFEDASELKPFSVSRQTNQQVWVDLRTDASQAPGTYRNGALVISWRTENGGRYSKQISLEVEVLPFLLSPTPLPHSLFYTGWMGHPYDNLLDGTNRSPEQVLADLRYMQAAGLTEPTFLHDYQPGSGQRRGLSELIALLGPLDYRTFIYWDRSQSQRQSPLRYAEKVKQLKTIAAEGKMSLLVYDLDEAPLEQLVEESWTLETVRSTGSGNFLAIQPGYEQHLGSLIDVALVHRSRTPPSGVETWAYNNPQGGEEIPYQYRHLYGFQLWLDGFDGACNFGYQTAHRPYDDWFVENWRPHNMTYPTATGVLPTLQWMGWREAIDDLRYLATLLAVKSGIQDISSVRQRTKLLESLLGKLPDHPDEMRAQIISALNDHE